MELSDLAVQRTKIRRLSVLKFLYDRDVINDEELGKLLSPDVGAAAAIEAGAEISKAVLKMETHPDQTLILEEEHLRRNVREQVGFSRNQLGEFTGGRRTATEAGIVNQASQSRIGRRGKAVKTAFREIFEVMNNIVFEHWTNPRVIQVLGQGQEQLWETVTGPGLKSRYAYDIEFSNDEDARRRKIEALQLYQMMSQDPSIDPIALRMFLADASSDPQFERLFNADIQNAMRVMRLLGGGNLQQGNSPQSGGPPVASLPGLQAANGSPAGANVQGRLVGSGGGSNTGASR
jgi:hypothetical protein